MPAIREFSFLQNCPFWTIDDDNMACIGLPRPSRGFRLFLRLEKSLPPFNTYVSRGASTTFADVDVSLLDTTSYQIRLERSFYHYHSRFSRLSPIQPTFDRPRLVRSLPLCIPTSREELKRLRISTSRYWLPLSMPNTSTNISTFDRSLSS